MKLKGKSKFWGMTLSSLLILSVVLITTFTAEGVIDNSIEDGIVVTNAGLTEHAAIYIGNNGDFEDYSFPGNGSAVDPYRIENLNITTTDDDAIMIVLTSMYFIIQNCYLQSVRYGMYMHIVGDYTGTILNNTVRNTDDTGIYLFDSDGFVIANNTLINNEAEKNMKLVNCENLVVANNTLMDCPKAALLVEGSTDCLFYNNHFESNTGYGMVFDQSSSDCVVYHSNFIQNKLGQSQAYVAYTCTNIQWYDDTVDEGSYWDNYIGTGNYTIAGAIGEDGGGEDPYPLAEALNLKLEGYPPSAKRPIPTTPTPTPTPTPTSTDEPTTPSETEESTWAIMAVLLSIGLISVTLISIRRKN